MLKRTIAIDMDDVIAMYTRKVLETLRRETGIAINPAETEGKFLGQLLDPYYVEIVSSYPFRKGFFRDLEVMPNSCEVIRSLTDYYDVTIVTACMQHPNSLNDKLAWLKENFTFIPFQKIIFCGEKQNIWTDFLLDDHPKHLANCRGVPLLFSAYHNVHEKKYKRFYDWLQLKDFFNGLT